MVEAACQAAVRRRRLSRGDRHVDVEDALGSAATTTALAALALFDHADRGADVLPALNRHGRVIADAFAACKKGAHTGYCGPLPALVDDTAKLTALLATP